MAETEPTPSVSRKRRRRLVGNLGPTLRDVARVAGVSTASVSRALSRPELVSDEVQARVTLATRTLGYVPNAAARTLAGHSERLVGAVVCGLDDPPTMHALEALSFALGARGVSLIMAIAGKREEAVASCMRVLLERGAEAMVYAGGATPIDPGRRRPWASLDESAARSTADGSGFDHAAALALVARYLQGLGHVQIALLGVGGARRVNGVRRALANTGIEIVSEGLAAETVTDVPLGDVFDRWVAMPAPPTAVVCGSDAVAVEVLQECKRRHIAVPGQLSVVGYGDTELSRQVQPPLSTLRVPGHEAGEALARILLAELDGRPEPFLELRSKLVVRESIGVRE